MKIEYADSAVHVTFAELDNGDVFSRVDPFCPNALWLKTDGNRAYSLRDGSGGEFKGHMRVVLRKAKVVVEDLRSEY